ncbi:unnamed protein product [Ectocarpus sp. CCAP 1310/34]|nr:unnamed protein product [Ectocarpus sp. CCAP 1310/34]
MFSGCMDSQTSADVKDVSKFGLPDADGAGGACTNAMLLTAMKQERRSDDGMVGGRCWCCCCTHRRESFGCRV